MSGYHHPLMDELFPPDRWFKTEGPDKTIHSTKDSRREVLWTNYESDFERTGFSRQSNTQGGFPSPATSG